VRAYAIVKREKHAGNKDRRDRIIYPHAAGPPALFSFTSLQQKIIVRSCTCAHSGYLPIARVRSLPPINRAYVRLSANFASHT